MAAVTLRESLAFTAFVRDYVLDSMPGDPPLDIPYLIQKWGQWQATLKEPHNGDCVNIPATCTRCLVEGYYTLADAFLLCWYDTATPVTQESCEKKEEEVG